MRGEGGGSPLPPSVFSRFLQRPQELQREEGGVGSARQDHLSPAGLSPGPSAPGPLDS